MPDDETPPPLPPKVIIEDYRMFALLFYSKKGVKEIQVKVKVLHLT